MTGEDIIDCIMEVDKILMEAELALQNTKYSQALNKLKEARSAIEDLREDDDADDTKEVEMNIMKKLK